MANCTVAEGLSGKSSSVFPLNDQQAHCSGEEGHTWAQTREHASAPRLQAPYFEEQFQCASQCAPVGIAWENLTTALVRLQAASLNELPKGPPGRQREWTMIHIISSVDQCRPVHHTPAGST